MARKQKNGGKGNGNGNDERTQRGPQGGRGRGRHINGVSKKGRGTAQANTGPSAAFLAALEAQRAKQAAEETTQQQSSCSGSGEATSTQTSSAATQLPRQQEHLSNKRAALPGFVFDETKGRYFKLSKQDQQLRQQKKRRADAAAHAQASHTAIRKARHGTNGGTVERLTARRSGWIGFLTRREIHRISATPTFGPCDGRGLVPRYYAARLANHDLYSVDLALDSARDRFTAMDVSADSSSLSIGYASGHLRTYSINQEDGSNVQELSEIGSGNTGASTISSIRCHSEQRLVLCTAIGAGVAPSLMTLLPRGGEIQQHQQLSGRVNIFSDPTLSRPPLTWSFADPWVAEWSPTTASQFSVGLNGQQGAAIVDVVSAGSPSRGVSMAPTGQIQSDTLSQSFCPQSPSTIANGSRDGSWWMWDTRSPRRTIEIPGKMSKKATTGAVQCLRVLSDARRMVLQRSNGELAVVDLRSPRQSLPSMVTLLAVGVQDVYRSMLRFDVDENETVVAAAVGDAVGVFDLRSGADLVQLRRRHEADVSPEQVCVRECQGRVAVWSLGRSAVYRSRPSPTEYSQ